MIARITIAIIVLCAYFGVATANENGDWWDGFGIPGMNESVYAVLSDQDGCFTTSFNVAHIVRRSSNVSGN